MYYCYVFTLTDKEKKVTGTLLISKFTSMRDNLIDRKLNVFQPKVKIKIDSGKFIVKTAVDGGEVKKGLRLRRSVFFEELLNESDDGLLDVDRFDFICDHLLLIDKESGAVVGTYRLNPSVFNKSFYSATEFRMGSIIKLVGNKLELGRSCVHVSFRNSLAIAVLWKGLTEYMSVLSIKWLFGCTSLMSLDSETIASVYLWLQNNHFAEKRFRVHPRLMYRVPHLEKYAKFVNSLPDEKRGDVKKIVPPLLRAYISAGAVVCGAPALDRDMRCADFFTLLDTDRIMERYERKFVSEK